MQKKGQFSILAVFQNVLDLHKFGLQIWIPNAKITLWKNFRTIFPISSIWVIRYAKKGQFSILAVIQNIWDLHKFGLQIWIQNAKITLWKNFRQFFPISSILVIRSGYPKKGQFLNISCISKCMGFTQISCCRFEFRTQKLPYVRISGNFSDFINFGNQVLRMRKNDQFLNITWYFKMYGIYINLGCRFEFRTQNITLWKNFSQFFRFHQFGSSGMRKKASFSILAVIQNIWNLHKFGFQIWIQNAKITPWKNFGQFFRFHQFWSSGPGMQKKVISQY